MTGEGISWREPEAGFRFEPGEVTVSAAHQQEKLGACGLDAGVFGLSVDPSFIIGIGIHAGIRNGISAEGNVNMLSSIIQHRPVQLDEPLLAMGEIRAVTPVPRGQQVETDTWFETLGGERVVSVPRISLRPDPAKAGTRGAGERPPPVIASVDGLTERSSHTLTPDQVKAYSSEGNSIHYEMEAAQKAGFRAPIIGGGMGVHFLMAAIWADAPPSALAVDIYFRRPIFWDDTFSVLVDRVGDDWSAICLARGEKVLTEARINQLE